MAKIKKYNEHTDKTADVLRLLLDFTETEERYIGGDDGPKIIFFKGSENKPKREFLTKIAERIVKKIK